MTILRRFLVLAALMFWQGGFMFYGSASRTRVIGTTTAP